MNWPSRRQAISPASLRILRWCETVAGVTPPIETISPQFICLVAEIVSKILRRVSSARALDIFSISEWAIASSKFSEIVALTARRKSIRPKKHEKACILILRYSSKYRNSTDPGTVFTDAPRRDQCRKFNREKV